MSQFQKLLIWDTSRRVVIRQVGLGGQWYGDQEEYTEKKLSLKSLLYQVNILCTSLQIEVLTMNLGEPKPFHDILSRPVYGNTASDGSLLQAQKWISCCISNHENCASGLPSRLPKRVVDLKLRNPRLYETHNELAQYVCLSHCWGTSRPSCATTSLSLKANQKCIEWESMPRTFQDAIHFTRRLGIRYIWIDSMCIIQDDERDWREQSAVMASIYQNAYLTLCATHSSSDDNGCYSQLPPDSVVQKGTMVKKDGVEYDVYFRIYPKNGRRKDHLPDSNCATSTYHLHEFPLMARAWTYQERLPSPRLLHFTSSEVHGMRGGMRVHTLHKVIGMKCNEV